MATPHDPPLIDPEAGQAVAAWSRRPAWFRYGVAVLVVVLATIASRTLQSLTVATTLAPFLGAVAFAAWFGGLKPTLLTIALSIFAIEIWETTPYGEWSLTWRDLGLLATFAIASGLITALSVSRDRAEVALHASEHRYRTILATANEGVWLIDREARTQYANDRMAALLGATPERVAASSVVDFVFPEDVPVARERIGANLAGRAEEFDFRFRREDGGEVLVLAGTSPVRDDAGRVVGALGLFTDITARTEAENALRLLAEAGRALASSLDFEETLQRVAWLAVPELADWCIIDLIDDESVTRRVAVAHADPGQADLAAQLMRYPPTATSEGLEGGAIRTGVPFFAERVSAEKVQKVAQNAAHLDLMQNLGVLSAIVVPLRAGGAIHGAMTLTTTAVSNRHFDDADLELAEQLGRRSAIAIQNARLYRDAQAAEARYRGLFEGTKDGIIVVDAGGNCVDVNPAMAGMVGYRREELIGQSTALVACGGPWSGDEGERLRRDGQWRGDFQLRRKNGSLAPVESWITRVRLPSGPVYVGVLRDVSERKQFEQLQEEFLSALAHDLKNPLTAVRGQTQLLRRRINRGETGDVARLAVGLEGIENAATRMAQLLDELSDIMRLRAGQDIELQREPIDLVALARRAADEHERLTERHTIRLETDLSEVVGFWDGPRLERVLGNLLGNAIKYSPEGGEIIVRLDREAPNGREEIALSVKDRGVGIPASDLTLIFEQFRRAGNVESIAGTGIGLAGTKRIVERHGGSVSVTSREGEGSTFTVRLPLSTGEA